MGKIKNLPQELILEILLRLPVKSLQRFKCVSKSWFSLISNPHFAKSHFELAATHAHNKLMLLAVSGSEARSIDIDAPFQDHAPAALKPNFLRPTSYLRIHIMGSCNGFLLLSDYSTLFLWNPSTGFHKQLPPSPISSNTSVSLFTFLYGFGYDESRHDYLVVQASYDPSVADLVTHLEFFSVRANSWRKIEGAHLPYMNAADDPKAGPLLNGAIHWLVLRHDTSVHVIIAFDMMERSFSEIPLPNDFDYDCQFVDLRVLGGCLGLAIDAGDGDAAVIWVMEEYRVQSSWTMTSVEIPVEYFSPVCFTKSGAIVGIGSGGGGLVKCNGEGEVLEDCTYFHDPSWCEAAVYTESLLSLPDESGQAVEDDRE